MNAYLVIYHTDNKVAIQGIRKAMEHFRFNEHISDHCSVVLTFRNEEDILKELRKEEYKNVPLLVVKIPSPIYLSGLPEEYFEPVDSQHY